MSKIKKKYKKYRLIIFVRQYYIFQNLKKL